MVSLVQSVVNSQLKDGKIFSKAYTCAIHLQQNLIPSLIFIFFLIKITIYLAIQSTKIMIYKYQIKQFWLKLVICIKYMSIYKAICAYAKEIQVKYMAFSEHTES